MAVDRTTSAYSAVLVSAVLWGFIGVFSRNLNDEGFDPMQVALMRMLIALLVVLAVLLAFNRGAFKIHKKDLWIFVFFAVFKLLSDIFLFQAQTMIHLSLSTVLQLTSPYYVLVFSVFLFGEKFTARKILAIFVGFVGCIFVTGLLSEDINFDMLGVALAIFSGISYAAYTVGTKVLLNRGYQTDTILFYIFLIACIICIPFSDAGGIPSKVDGLEPLLNLLCIGILMTLAPYYLQAYAMHYLSPVKVNLIGLVEVLTAVVVGYMFYDESLGWMNLIGMVLIPLSIVIMNVELHRRAKSEYHDA